MSAQLLVKEDTHMMHKDSDAVTPNRRRGHRNVRLMLAVLATLGAWTRVLVDLLRH
jgi:hypothetical protein